MPSTVYEYFLRACHRGMQPLRGTQGALVSDQHGNSAVFWLECEAGRIQQANYKATTCTTLLAVCERLCELASGLDTRAVLELSAEQILTAHPEIPAEKRDVVFLAVRALRSAAARAASES